MHEMPDEWRWRFMAHILGMREGFVQDHYDRVIQHANFRMHVGQPWLDAREAGGRAMLTTPAGEYTAHFLITGTGVSMDPVLLPELTHCAHNIAQWGDCYARPRRSGIRACCNFPTSGRTAHSWKRPLARRRGLPISTSSASTPR